MELKINNPNINKIGTLKEPRIIHILEHFSFPKIIFFGILNFTRKYPIKNEDTFSEFCQIIKNSFWNSIIEVNKLTALNYIYDNKNWDIYDSLSKNIDFLVHAFWKDVFLKKDKNQIHWAQLWSESDLFINLSGWAWAWTFSIDLSIWWLNSQKTWVNPLVHVSFDTMMIGNKRFGRIIRLWRVIKPWEDTKTAMLDKYTNKFKWSPEMYLIQCAIRMMADLGITEFIWLSTDWAHQLSSLGKSKSWFDYSRLFNASWFDKSSENKNWHWLSLPDWNWYKYFANQTTRYINTSLTSHFDSFDEIPEIKNLALKNTQTRTRNQVFLLIAWSIIAWKFGWDISDL